MTRAQWWSAFDAALTPPPPETVSRWPDLPGYGLLALLPVVLAALAASLVMARVA